MTRRILPAIVLVLLAAVGVVPAMAADVAFTAPTAHGPAGLGDRIEYALSGGCKDRKVVAVLVAAGRRVASAPAKGCKGAVQVPTAAALGKARLSEHQVERVLLEVRGRGGAVALELAPKRLMAARAEVVEGKGAPAPSKDPMNGGPSLELQGERATFAFGPVDLSGVSSLSFRIATPDDDSRLCGGDGLYCIGGRLVVNEGSPHGPVVTTAEVPGRGGWHDWTRIVQEVLPTPGRAAGPVKLFVTAHGPRCGAAATPDSPFGRCGNDPRLLNVGYVELNGSGVALAPKPVAPGKGAVDLLANGLEGWTTAGLAHYSVDEEGVLTSEGSFGLLWYSAREFGDFVLNLDFRVASVSDNSGVYLRTAEIDQNSPLDESGYEIQVQDYGETYPGSNEGSQTGAAYGVSPADRINTRTIGEWNHYRITVVGHRYTIELNGKVVNTFTGDKRLSGYIGLQSHDPQSQEAFRNIVVTPL